MMFTTKRVVFYSGIAAAIILLGVLLFATKKSPNDVTTPSNVSTPTSFFECAEQGDVILESYPRQCKTSGGRTFVEDIGNEFDKLDVIQIDAPRPNAFVSSPLRIYGQARGTWFFEGSFPLYLVDDDGNIVAEGFAAAEEEWMTEEFIPYSSIIEFSIPAESATGILTLKKDNPSGLPENEDSLVVPVRFR